VLLYQASAASRERIRIAKWVEIGEIGGSHAVILCKNFTSFD
jgi:hypothetical protein